MFVGLLTLGILAGCQHTVDPASLWQWPMFGAPQPPPAGVAGPVPAPPQPRAAPTNNPMRVPSVDREFLWNQLVDTVDDYFRIDSERRVHVVGGVLTEGRIETFYLPGATALEPWRWDSASNYELAYATLQSIRRRASIRVVPVGSGYDIHVTVFKELEDLEFPAQATPGSSTARHDGTLARTDRYSRGGPVTLGWISQGRDLALEQAILREFYARITTTQQPGGRNAR